MTAREDGFLNEALAYVYVSQYVRPDGPTRAGVLDHDCRGFFGQLEELVDDGYVERIGWRQLEGFRTTSKGSTRAKHIVTEHLEAAKNRINSGLGQIPRKVLQFIIWEIMNVDELRFGYSGRIDLTPENSSTSK